MIGSYELLERIGHGGMGEVWRAQHRMLGRQAAVKLIRPEALGAESGDRASVTLRRFEKEARATAALRSPHTIELYDFGLASDGTFYYVMELLEGLDLQSLVQRHGALPPARAVYLLRQVCESLAEAHHRGLIHRDIKPANVFCCQLGLKVDYVKVLDFGLVKLASGAGDDSGLTVDGAVPGSPAFMAPEAIRSEPDIDARVDLYSLGCVAYWLLSGKRVFEGRTPLELVLAHLQREPEALSSRAEGPIPAALDDLVMACLSKDPAGRPASILDVDRALAACPVGDLWDEEKSMAWWRQHDPVRRWEETRRLQAPAGDQTESTQLDPTPPARRTAAAGDGADSVSAELLSVESLSVDGSDSSLASPGVLTARVVDHFTSDTRGRQLSQEGVVDLLKQQFDASRIDVFEYDRRTAMAQLADTHSDLRAALEGLVIPSTDRLPEVRSERTPAVIDSADQDAASPVKVAAVTAPTRGHTAEWNNMVSVFSAAIRKGAWRAAPRTRVVSVFGGAELDFRAARLEPGMNEFRFICVFGGADVVLPPELYVEVEGFGIFGGFSETGTDIHEPPEGAPWLRISGVAVFGGVSVTTRPPGPPDRTRKSLPEP